MLARDLTPFQRMNKCYFDNFFENETTEKILGSRFGVSHRFGVKDLACPTCFPRLWAQPAAIADLSPREVGPHLSSTTTLPLWPLPIRRTPSGRARRLRPPAEVPPPSGRRSWGLTSRPPSSVLGKPCPSSICSFDSPIRADVSMFISL
jgi:hypothetical protein